MLHSIFTCLVVVLYACPFAAVNTNVGCYSFQPSSEKSSVDAGTLFIDYLYDPSRDGILSLPAQPPRTSYQIFKQIDNSSITLEPSTLEAIPAESMDLADTLGTMLELATKCTSGEVAIGSGNWRLLILADGALPGGPAKALEARDTIEILPRVVAPPYNKLQRRSTDRVRLVPGTGLSYLYQLELQPVSQFFSHTVALWSDNEYAMVQVVIAGTASLILQSGGSASDLDFQSPDKNYYITMKLNGMQDWNDFVTTVSNNAPDFKSTLGTIIGPAVKDLANRNTVTGAYELVIQDADTNDPFGLSVVFVVTRLLTSPYLIPAQDFESLLYQWKTSGACVDDTTDNSPPNKRDALGSSATLDIAQAQSSPIPSMQVATALNDFIFTLPRNVDQDQMNTIWDNVFGNEFGLPSDVFIRYKAQDPGIDSIESINDLLCLGTQAAQYVAERETTEQQLCNLWSNGSSINEKRDFKPSADKGSELLGSTNNRIPRTGHLLNQIAQGNLRFEYYRFYPIADQPEQLGMEVVYLLGRDAAHIDDSLQDHSLGQPIGRFAVLHYHIGQSIGGGFAVHQFNVRHAEDLRSWRRPANRIVEGSRRAQSANVHGAVVVNCRPGDEPMVSESLRFWVPIHDNGNPENSNELTMLIHEATSAIDASYIGGGPRGLFAAARAAQWWNGDVQEPADQGWNQSLGQTWSYDREGRLYVPPYDIQGTRGFLNFNTPWRNPNP